MIPGLVSITFRALKKEEIVKLCEKNGLRAIEWGGDIHVPAGDLSAARNAAALCKDSGIKTAAYGSYYKLDEPEELFTKNLDTAAELGAPVIRIWAGSKPTEMLEAGERERLIERFERLRLLSGKAGITLAPEFHMNSLTDSIPSLEKLLAELPELKLYWQPRWEWSEDDRLKSLGMIGDRLVNIHVFTWRIENRKEIRLPLADGEQMWKKALTMAKQDVCAMLEFVPDNNPEFLPRDAAVLRSWLGEV